MHSLTVNGYVVHARAHVCWHRSHHRLCLAVRATLKPMGEFMSQTSVHMREEIKTLYNVVTTSDNSLFLHVLFVIRQVAGVMSTASYWSVHTYLAAVRTHSGLGYVCPRPKHCTKGTDSAALRGQSRALSAVIFDPVKLLRNVSLLGPTQYPVRA